MAEKEATQGWWAQLVGTAFVTGSVELTLTEVTDEVVSGPFCSYSIVFTAAEPVVLAQGTYRLVGGDGDGIDVFLVQLSPDTFESVYSHAVAEADR